MKKWWNAWTRKRDGWVERNRRFQDMLGERFFGAANQRVPALVGAPARGARETVPTRRAE